MTELPIEGFPGYTVNSKGEVISRLGKKPRVLRQHIRNGYASVALYSNGIPKRFNVHRLVAIAFLGQPPVNLVVNHKNGIRLDNRVENLEWVTISENIAHAYSTGLAKALTKEQYDKRPRDRYQKNALLTMGEASDLVEFLSVTGMNANAAAKIFPITSGTIYNILNGKQKNFKDGSITN